MQNDHARKAVLRINIMILVLFFIYKLAKGIPRALVDGLYSLYRNCMMYLEPGFSPVSYQFACSNCGLVTQPK